MQEKNEKPQKVKVGDRVYNLMTSNNLRVVGKNNRLRDNGNKLLVWTVEWNKSDKSSNYTEQEITITQ